MDSMPALARSWAVGLVILLFTEYVQMKLIHDTMVAPDGTDSFGATLALIHLPHLACVALATWAAARAYPEPWREIPARQVAAACAVPVAAQLLALPLGWEGTGFAESASWMSAAVLLAGCTAGLLLDKLVWTS